MVFKAFTEEIGIFIAKRLFDTLKDALFPPVCKACGAFFHPAGSARQWTEVVPGAEGDNRFARLMAPHLCAACSRQFTAADSPLCLRCGLVFKSRFGEDRVCGECLAAEKPFGMARSAGVYDQAMMAVIHAYKYGARIELARPFSQMLKAVFQHHWPKGSIDLVLPVPLHPQRLRSRGFNQAYLMVRSWGKIVARDVLRRRQVTPPQTGLGRKERFANVRGAFTVADPRAVEGRRLLLVDDVYTTGATVSECAGVLKKSGALRVDVLTVARAV